MVISVFLAGCGQEKQSVQIGQPVKEADTIQQSNTEAGSNGEMVLRNAKKEEVGATAVCSVMGSEFTIKENTWVAEYKGKTYPFCCEGCIKPFSDNPDKYAK